MLHVLQRVGVFSNDLVLWLHNRSVFKSNFDEWDEDHLRFLHTEGHHGFKVFHGSFVCVLFEATFHLQTNVIYPRNL